MAENMTVVAADGTITTYQQPNETLDGGSFFAGMFVAVAAMLAAKIVKRRKARAAARRDDRDGARFGDDYAALAQRTATLERIVTEPATRLDREIEALR
ncbi:hypothetical protein [Glacieibacterium frigidum]|uniref:Uncharacterized protein n=1 Tax=Glacieibacterium frigidum TaxID=2593303 RepID=A0A552U9T2_9SPHN|nr:hypothetical protein [Glacieibacterium frigidum]TRW14984.1 hypothetical protein FMM06_15105 [Glacieibacterium frigidum]